MTTDYCQNMGCAKQNKKINVQYQIFLVLQLTKNMWK